MVGIQVIMYSSPDFLLWTELCPPPPLAIHILQPNLQCNGIWRWNFWNIIRFDEVLRVEASEWG